MENVVSTEYLSIQVHRMTQTTSSDLRVIKRTIKKLKKNGGIKIQKYPISDNKDN